MAKSKNANYKFEKKDAAPRRMGAGSFADLPDRPIYRDFGPPTYRDGVINSFTSSISEISDIDENRC